MCLLRMIGLSFAAAAFGCAHAEPVPQGEHASKPSSTHDAAEEKENGSRCQDGLAGGDFTYTGFEELGPGDKVEFEYRPDLTYNVRKIWDKNRGEPSALNIADYIVFHGAAPYSSSVFALIDPNRPCPKAGCETYFVIHSLADKSLRFLTFYGQDSIAIRKLPHLVIDDCVVTGVAFDPPAHSKQAIESNHNGSGAPEGADEGLDSELYAYWAKHEKRE